MARMVGFRDRTCWRARRTDCSQGATDRARSRRSLCSLSFVNATRIPFANAESLPSSPGFYLVYSVVRLAWLNWDPSSGVAYIGGAEHDLRSRAVRVHSGDTGRSTLRRTLGALLKEELALVAMPRRSRGKPQPIHFRNYDFEPDGNARLNEWMRRHLEVSCLTGVDIKGGRSLLIAEHLPPLNLTGWDNPLRPEIMVARAKCTEEARRRYREE